MHTDALLAHLLVQLAVIVAFARLGGIAAKRLGQPVVCGEIAAGLILGPSVLGNFLPGVSAEIFSKDTAQAFTALSELGLVLLLFLIGIDFDFQHLKAHKGKPFVVSAVGITVPFALGLGVAQVIHSEVAPSDIDKLTFALFIALTLSITALPILGRILIEFGLNRAPLGVLTITSAAVDDAIGWILLALVTSIATTGADWGKVGLMMVETIGYAVFIFVIARPMLKRWARAAVRRGDGVLALNDLAVLLVLLLCSGLITHEIGIFAIFGAFMLGAVFHDETEFRQAVLMKLNDFVTVFFLPIFFTYTGLRTDIGSMSGALLWAMCGLVVAAGIAGKLGGCTLAARATGLPWRDSYMVGVLMNARALMALIVINVGLTVGILSSTAFFMLVMMAVITTFMTAPLLRVGLKKAPQSSLAHIPAPIQRRPEQARPVVAASGVATAGDA
jgi:Kef-type K+ transport system membrane component KefB